MEKDQKLIIVGDSVFAQVAYEFFTHDSPYQVVAFTVERAYLRAHSMFDLPVIAFEDIVTFYPPGSCSFFVAVVFSQQNRLRTRLYNEAKAKGYSPASYVGSQAFVHHTAEVGEHCFICEKTVVQPWARVLSNVVVWSGNYVGHHSLIKSNSFTLPHAVISDFAQVGENCVVGPNATILERVSIGDDCWIEAGSRVSANLETRTRI
jgi:sugar O-acyltransferase (sialic acid O-acetyltransferase NeuD family)